ncbi:MAG: DUF2922 domain-containing protein [Firmicutes bacterium]|nr:DUF2922 domain-containing protein [Bacillota bacterium]
MPITTSQTLRMVFRSQGGTSMTISLDNPRTDVTAAEIETVMDTIITKNVFSTNGGDLASKYDIKVVDRTTNDLYDPA